MTEVAFHFNLSDKLLYACRLLRKAHAAGAKVLVVAAAADPASAEQHGAALQQLDAALWTFTAQEFVPHCWADAPAHTLSQTPIVLLRDAADLLPERLSAIAPALLQTSDVLLNMGDAVAQGFERYKRVIELVGNDEADKQAARQRWRYYSERGYPLKRHDLAGKSI